MSLIRGKNESGAWRRFEYDAAGRLVKIKDDSNNVLETYTYGASRNRLKNETSTQRTYYAWGGNSPLVEYTEATASSTPAYSKSYVYAGSRLISTATKATSTTETTEYHHADRLGTRLVTNHGSSTNYQQSTLPYGTALGAESSGYSNQIFTSYDRSASTGLDYAVNRTYSPGQGRFTQVDPIGMVSASIGDPQSNNLYAYVQNRPIDFLDSLGLNAEAELTPGEACSLRNDDVYDGTVDSNGRCRSHAGNPVNVYWEGGWVIVIIGSPPVWAPPGGYPGDDYPGMGGGGSPAPQPQPQPAPTPGPPAPRGPQSTPCLPGTLQLGIAGTAVGGIVAGTVEGGLAIDTSGNVGVYGEGGGRSRRRASGQCWPSNYCNKCPDN